MKKLIYAVICIIIIILLPITSFAQENNETEITKGNIVTISDRSNSNAVTDSNRFTKLNLKKDTCIKLTNTEVINSIYLIWDKPPGEWKLSLNCSEFTYGQYGYIHEYINLPFTAQEITITIKSDEAVLCDVYSFKSGVIPEWVQQWTPPCQKADILLLPTHADDELIFFGGTIPYYAKEKGYNVQVAYMTHHWGEPYRPHEALNSLWACGLTSYPVMGEFPDIYSTSLEHAKKVYDYNKVVDYTTGLIRKFKPEVIIGHDLKGEYGHGGHMIFSNALCEAVNKSSDNTFYPESAETFGIWDVPKTYLHLYDNNKIKMNWDIPLESFNGKTAYEMAVYGFSFHSSQQKWYSVKKEPGVYDCQDFGLFRTTVGNDTGANDFMENIKQIDIKGEISSDNSKSSNKNDLEVNASAKNSKATKRYLLFIIPLCLIIISAVSVFVITKRRKAKN